MIAAAIDTLALFMTGEADNLPQCRRQHLGPARPDAVIDAAATVAPVRFPVGDRPRVLPALPPAAASTASCAWRRATGPDVELERLLEILAADCQWMRPGRKGQGL